MRSWNVRKYSFLNNKSDWEHFPYRDSILLEIDGNAFKIVWNFTLLQSFTTNNIHGLSIYTKFPSIGFKYHQNGEIKRFQLGFSERSDFDSVVEYLMTNGHINSKKQLGITSANIPQMHLLPSSQPLSSAVDLTPERMVNVLNTENFEIPSTQMMPPTIQQPPVPNQVLTSFSQPSFAPFSQPHVTTSLYSSYNVVKERQNDMSVSRRTDDHKMDYLSQILNEPKGLSMKELNFSEMTDEEIKDLLREKIKDVNFINFVERIENCLKGLH